MVQVKLRIRCSHVLVLRVFGPNAWQEFDPMDVWAIVGSVGGIWRKWQASCQVTPHFSVSRCTSLQAFQWTENSSTEAEFPSLEFPLASSTSLKRALCISRTTQFVTV